MSTFELLTITCNMTSLVLSPCLVGSCSVSVSRRVLCCLCVTSGLVLSPCPCFIGSCAVSVSRRLVSRSMSCCHWLSCFKEVYEFFCNESALSGNPNNALLWQFNLYCVYGALGSYFLLCTLALGFYLYCEHNAHVFYFYWLFILFYLGLFFYWLLKIQRLLLLLSHFHLGFIFYCVHCPVVYNRLWWIRSRARTDGNTVRVSTGSVDQS